MTAVLRELLLHKTWATLRLFDYCLALPAEHLEATGPGTYGSVADTLRHLVQADQNYYRMLTGTDIGPLPGEDAGLAPVAERFRELSGRWEAVMLDPSAAERDTRNRFGTAKGVAPLAQSIHHADDHRTQILSILGARGLEPPALDIWAHGLVEGFVTVNAAAPA